MELNQAQREAIRHKDGPMLVLALTRFRKDFSDN